MSIPTESMPEPVRNPILEDETNMVPTGTASSAPSGKTDVSAQISASQKVIQDFLEVVKDASTLTPEQMLELLKKEKSRIDNTYADLPQLPDPQDATPEQMMALVSQVQTIGVLYSLIGILAASAQAQVDAKASQETSSSEGDVKSAEEAPTTPPTNNSGYVTPGAHQRPVGGTQGPTNPLEIVFLAGSAYVAMNIAIMTMARQLSQITKQESLASQKMRDAEAENIKQQVANINWEGELKKTQMLQAAYVKFAQAGAHILGTAAMAAKAGMGKDAGERFSGFVNTMNHTISSFFEAGLKLQDAGFQPDLATAEAKKVFLRDVYEAIKQQHQNSQKFITDYRDVLNRALDGLAQMIAETRRAQGIGLR